MRIPAVSPILSLLLTLHVSAAVDFKSTPLQIQREGKTGLTLLSPTQTGFAFTTTLSDKAAEKNRILENGSGLALGDIDGDGLCDIYVCALERPNALFKNLGGWKFAELPAANGAACAGQSSTGAAFADVDGDGDLDLLVNGIASGTRLFRNDGKGNFTEDMQSGLERKSGATSLALADIDGDSDLDLYVATYRSATIRDGATPGFQAFMQNGKLVALPAEQFEVQDTPNGPQLIEMGEPDFLYLNDGSGKFTAVSWTDGRFLDEDGKPLRESRRYWSLAAMFRDLNNDGAPDLYVCNDFISSPDEIWINDGKGNFRLIPKLAIRHTSWSSMSVDVADINHDGHMDLFVADMLSPDNVRRQTQKANAELGAIRIRPGEIDNRPQNFQNTLQLARGDGTYAEISQLAGLQATDWTWSAIFLDVDLDGWEDLLVTTGNLHDIQDADTSIRLAPILNTPPHLRKPILLEYPPLRTPRRAYRNNHDLTFTEQSREWGFDQIGISQAMALADLDNDGDLDVVVSNLNDLIGLYRNDSTAPRLAIRLRGKNAIGSRIEVQTAALKQTQELIAGGRYLAGDDAIRTFAAPVESQITVHWQSGAISKLEKIAPNQLLEISEPAEKPPQKTSAPESIVTWFEDVSDRLNHTHSEAPFDDWGLQPLLPNRLSLLGPKILFTDFDGDGWEDLIIGASRGGHTALFKNNKTGGFLPIANQTAPATGDQDDIIALGTNRVAIAISNLEGAKLSDPSVILQRFQNDTLETFDTLPGQTSAAGSLVVGDMDGDGQPELFVGSRFIPGRYPESGPSRIFRHTQGHWKLDRPLTDAIAAAGLVTGAQFTDLDADGDLDLVLSCDWSTPKIFRNDKGKLTDATESYGLAKFTGRWNNIIAADFNNDGRPDLLVANWGRNTRLQRYLAKPLRLTYGDFNFDKHLDTLESVFDPTLQKYVPWRGRHTVARAILSIHERFPTFASYGAAGVEDILLSVQSKTLEAATLDTVLFLNRTNHFEPAPLPIEVQFAPTMALAAADFDNDGKLDIFLAQNFFALHDEVTRMDASRGLLLKGDGQGAFQAIPGHQSGLLIYGEQRACAAADFNHDGKIDLAVTQNSGPTKLYLNRTGTR